MSSKRLSIQLDPKSYDDMKKKMADKGFTSIADFMRAAIQEWSPRKRKVAKKVVKKVQPKKTVKKVAKKVVKKAAKKA